MTNYGFGPLVPKNADDYADTENLLPAEAQPLIQRGPSWCVFALCITVTSCLSVMLGAQTGNVTRIDADAFSMRHVSQAVKSIWLQTILSRFLGTSLRNTWYPNCRRGPVYHTTYKTGLPIQSHSIVLIPHSTYNGRYRHTLH
jgi:hypothetical protein